MLVHSFFRHWSLFLEENLQWYISNRFLTGEWYVALLKYKDITHLQENQAHTLCETQRLHTTLLLSPHSWSRHYERTVSWVISLHEWFTKAFRYYIMGHWVRWLLEFTRVRWLAYIILSNERCYAPLFFRYFLWIRFQCWLACHHRLAALFIRDERHL